MNLFIDAFFFFGLIYYSENRLRAKIAFGESFAGDENAGYDRPTMKFEADFFFERKILKKNYNGTFLFT